MLVEELSHDLPSVLGNHPWGAWGSGNHPRLCPLRALLAALPGKPGIKAIPTPNTLNLESGQNIKIFLFPGCLCPLSSVFPGTLRCSCAVPSRNVLPAALQRFVSFLVYCPPSLMTHSGRDLFVVTVTPTSVNKASLPSLQSGSCRWHGPASNSSTASGCQAPTSKSHPLAVPRSARGRGAALASPKTSKLRSRLCRRSLQSSLGS